jgi:transketolase
VALGEDGPTHQPIEQLAGLRAIPNLNVFRPADINETLECWQIALKSKNTPSAIVLSRQKLPYINPSLSKGNKCELGAYEVHSTSANNQVTLIASGSEVEIAISAANKLKDKNIQTKVISFPSMEIFDEQPKSYQSKILNETKCKISIEASHPMSWKKYIGDNGISLGIEEFGKSAPYKEVYKYFKLTDDDVVKKAIELIN